MEYTINSIINSILRVPLGYLRYKLQITRNIENTIQIKIQGMLKN